MGATRERKEFCNGYSISPLVFEAPISGDSVKRDNLREDLAEAQTFVKSLLELVCAKASLIYASATPVSGEGIECFSATAGGPYRVTRNPLKPEFVSSTQMQRYWHRIFGTRRTCTKKILHIIRRHCESRRIVGIKEKRTRACNGYLILESLLQDFVNQHRELFKRGVGFDVPFTVDGDQGVSPMAEGVGSGARANN